MALSRASAHPLLRGLGRLLAGNALLAAAVTLVFNGLFFTFEPPTFTLEVTLRASMDAQVQVYYDLGHGLREADSSSQLVQAHVPTLCRFPLPEGEYRALRFDPVNHRGEAAISEMVLRSPAGVVLRRFHLGEFEANSQLTVQSQADGWLTLVAREGDPFFDLALSPPLVLHAGRLSFFYGAARKSGMMFALVFGCLVLAQLATRAGANQLARGWAARRVYPLRALAMVSAAAALLACHPLVLGGKSLLSPNFGIALVYESPPTVPHFLDPQRESAQGADIGAMMWQHLPYTAIARQALGTGELPLWNRYSSTGLTLLGQGQSMMGDPLHLPVILADAASWAFDAKFVLLRGLFACGLAWTVFALCRDWSAAAIVAGAAPFIGFFTFRINHPSIFSLCYAPWILFAWVRIIQADTARAAGRQAALWFAANGIVLASGTVKEAYMLIATLNAVGFAAFVFSPDPGGRKRRKVAIMAVTGLAFGLAAMPLWLTFADALVRSQNFSEQPVALRVPRQWLIGLWDDLFYRELDPERRVLFPSMNLLLGVGVVWALARWRALFSDPVSRWFLLGGLVAVGVAFEWIPSAWILRVPGLANLQRHGDVFSAIAIVLLGVVAGCGFAAARRWFGHPAERRAETAALLVLVPAVLLALYFSDPRSPGKPAATFAAWLAQVPEHGFFYASLLALSLGLFGLHAIAGRALRPGAITWRGAAWSALILVLVLARHGLQLPLGFREAYFLTPPARANLQATSPAIERLRAETALTPARVIGTGTTLVPNFGAQFGLEAICGPDALMNRHYRQLMMASGLGLAHDWYIGGSIEKLTAQHAVLDLLNVKFCISRQHDLPAATGYRRIADLDLALYVSPTVWPRAFFTDRIVSYQGAHEVAERARAHPGAPFAAVLESDVGRLPAGVARSGDREGPAAVAASNYRLTPNSTSFEVHAPGAGVIVLHEAWLKGDFRATVNDAPAEYFRVNHAFKGIAVPGSGDYRVTFTYWPRHLTRSLVYSACGFALLGLMLMLTRRGARPPET